MKTKMKKLEKWTGNKNTVAYKAIKQMLEMGKVNSVENVLRPCHTSGKGRFTTNLDYTEDFKELLNFLGIKYEFGNDSPRGGKTGNYIKIFTS